MAFVESNRTQALFQREIRFGPRSEGLKLLQNGIFGPNARVTIDYYVNEQSWPYEIGREHQQRSLIIQRWKQNGMTIDDIGYLSDVDETFSRDFFRAMQICDVKEFDRHENCKDPKVAGSTLVFEGGPKCLTKRRWYHPDMVRNFT